MGEDRHVDAEPGDLPGFDGGKAGVAHGGGRRHVADRLPEGHVGLDVADAAAKVVAAPQGNKNGPLLAKGAARVLQIREVAAAGGGLDRLAGQIQERFLVLGGQHAPSLPYFLMVLVAFWKLVGWTWAPGTIQISTRRESLSVFLGSDEPWPSTDAI